MNNFFESFNSFIDGTMKGLIIAACFKYLIGF